jgi:CheY-like chemotaxis protein
MRIAYVEDNPTNLALVERVASLNRHTIVPYSEGEIAAQELLREKFDLILMDVELAGEMGGLQVVRRLREGGLKTPIVAVTAYAMMGDREKCIEAGCTDYLPKPLPINDLLILLAKYDALSRADAQPVATPAASTEQSTPQDSAKATVPTIEAARTVQAIAESGSAVPASQTPVQPADVQPTATEPPRPVVSPVSGSTPPSVSKPETSS